MSQVITYALIADGPSDRALLPILRWSMRRVLPLAPFSMVAFVPRAAKPIAAAIEQVRKKYRPQLIFVHRDAEKAPFEVRRREIPSGDGLVAVIPVRMTEAWLLLDEAAVRRAAGNPNGRMELLLPSAGALENLADPKQVLKTLLEQASGGHGRRLERFNRAEAVQRVADHIADFSPLGRLSAYREFARELDDVVHGPAFACLL